MCVQNYFHHSLSQCAYTSLVPLSCPSHLTSTEHHLTGVLSPPLYDLDPVPPLQLLHSQIPVLLLYCLYGLE